MSHNLDAILTVAWSNRFLVPLMHICLEMANVRLGAHKGGGSGDPGVSSVINVNMRYE